MCVRLYVSHSYTVECGYILWLHVCTVRQATCQCVVCNMIVHSSEETMGENSFMCVCLYWCLYVCVSVLVSCVSVSVWVHGLVLLLACASSEK